MWAGSVDIHVPGTRACRFAVASPDAIGYLGEDFFSLPRNASVRPPSRRSEDEAEHARNRILDAAARAFTSGGMREIRLEEVAREAGYSVASLYNYFKNKEAILAALVDRALSEFVAACEFSAPASVPPEAALEWLALRLLRVGWGNVGLAAIVLSPKIVLGSDLKQELTERYMAVHRRFLDAIATRVGAVDGVAASDVDPLSYLLLGIMRTEIFRWLIEQQEVDESDLERAAHRLTRFFVAGARALGGPA